MGYGNWTRDAYTKLLRVKGYDHRSRSQIFAASHIDPAMDPRNAAMRESRDSEEHPDSQAIIIALDVTGSMGFVPEIIVRKSLPDLMDRLMEAGVKHPQVLFMGLGDYVYDAAPLQVGQFESSAELLDRWLTKVYLEGGGGANNWESYNLAYLFAARHTGIDCWEKRKRKGALITIGDEPCAPNIPGEVIRDLTTEKQAGKVSTATLLEEARERYEVMHLHLDHDSYAATRGRKQGWKKWLGDDFIVLQDYERLAEILADLVVAKCPPTAGVETAGSELVAGTTPKL